jgi:hypothetical protein
MEQLNHVQVALGIGYEELQRYLQALRLDIEHSRRPGARHFTIFV